MSAFIFNHRADVKAVHQAELPAGIKRKEALMDALSVAFRFPDYFGRNWDAVDECIRDLSWLPPGDVILSHKDLPLSEDRTSLSTYLSILHDAVENWTTIGSNMIFASPEKPDTSRELELLVKRKFLVLFPAETKTLVQGLLADIQKPGGSSGGSPA